MSNYSSWIKRFESSIDQLNEKVFKEDYQKKIILDSLDVLGRSGSIIKTGLGTWTHTSEIEQRMRINFSLEHIFVEFKEGQLRVHVSANLSEHLVKKFVEKYYGLPCLVLDFLLTDRLEDILISSQKKSKTEAVLEWCKKKDI